MTTGPEQSKDYVDDSITLEILSAVEDDSRVTQRTLSNSLGIALGLTNTYIKRCLKKGLIKIITAPANRYAYYLTPKGFSEKGRLTKEFLFQSFKFFRAARDQCSYMVEICINNHWDQILLVGTGDLSEIAILWANEKGVNLVGVYDQGCRTREFCGVKVYNKFGDLPQFDAVIMVDLGLSQDLVDQFSRVKDAHKILIPEILGFKRTNDPYSMDVDHG